MVKDGRLQRMWIAYLDVTNENIREWRMEEQVRTAVDRLRILNRDAIKYIAVVTMLLNHIAHMFLEKGTPVYEVLEDIGIFTAPVMCYFLVEGYMYTRSKVRYGLRLFVFALISQFPFMLASESKSLNMIFTLFCCFLILTVLENVRNPMLRIGLCTVLIFATLMGDWAVVAPLTTILIRDAWGDRQRIAMGFGTAYLFFAILNVQNYMYGEQENWTAYAVSHSLFSGFGILAAAITVLFLYNGERTVKCRNFSKWFFYIFYPAHLLILYLIKISLHNAY